MVSDNICFFIIESYSSNAILDFVLMLLIQSFVATGSIMGMAADTNMVLFGLRLPGHPPALVIDTVIAKGLDPAIATSACSDLEKNYRIEYGYGYRFGFGGRCVTNLSLYCDFG
jgi:hypothetical protein